MYDVIRSDYGQTNTRSNRRHNNNAKAWLNFKCCNQLLASHVIRFSSNSIGIPIDDGDIELINLLEPKFQHALKAFGHHKQNNFFFVFTNFIKQLKHRSKLARLHHQLTSMLSVTTVQRSFILQVWM